MCILYEILLQFPICARLQVMPPYFCINASYYHIIYWNQLSGVEENFMSFLILIAPPVCSWSRSFPSLRFLSVHLEKWCVLKHGWRRSISRSQAEGHKIEQTRRHQLEQLVSWNVLKFRLPLHKPLLAHHCRYRYGSVHALQIVSPSLQHQFTQMSHFRDAHLYSRNQKKTPKTHSLKQTGFYTCLLNLHMCTPDRVRWNSHKKVYKNISLTVQTPVSGYVIRFFNETN